MRGIRHGWSSTPAGLLTLAALLAAPVGGGAAGQTPAPPVEAVVIISIDGLRPDAIEAFGLARLERLMREGSHSLEARTVLPSRTLPSHASMLTGVSPAVHGLTWNHRLRGAGPVHVPTVFELARAQGLHTAAFYAKAKFRHLDRPDSYDHREAPSSNLEYWMVTDIVPAAVRYLQHRRPHLLFVHVSEPDYAGHLAGWMSWVYGLAARRADAAVGRVLEAADRAYGPGGYTVIVTSDHGGHERGHGSDDPRDVLIPWIVHGRCVEPGRAPDGIRTMDTAATALWLLGLPIPAAFEGRPVRQSFSGTCRRAP